MDKERKEYIHDWLLKAGSDLKSASILLHSPEDEKPFDTICFHCQQTVEKMLKVLLIDKDVIFPKTHDISVLVSLCCELYPDIKKFQDADILTPYAVTLRYPDDFYMPSEKEAREAFQIANDLNAFVLNILQEKN